MRGIAGPARAQVPLFGAEFEGTLVRGQHPIGRELPHQARRRRVIRREAAVEPTPAAGGVGDIPHAGALERVAREHGAVPGDVGFEKRVEPGLPGRVPGTHRIASPVELLAVSEHAAGLGSIEARKRLPVSGGMFQQIRERLHRHNLRAVARLQLRQTQHVIDVQMAHPDLFDAARSDAFEDRSPLIGREVVVHREAGAGIVEQEVVVPGYPQMRIQTVQPLLADASAFQALQRRGWRKRRRLRQRVEIEVLQLRRAPQTSRRDGEGFFDTIRHRIAVRGRHQRRVLVAQFDERGRGGFEAAPAPVVPIELMPLPDFAARVDGVAGEHDSLAADGGYVGNVVVRVAGCGERGERARGGFDLRSGGDVERGVAFVWNDHGVRFGAVRGGEELAPVIGNGFSGGAYGNLARGGFGVAEPLIAVAVREIDGIYVTHADGGQRIEHVAAREVDQHGAVAVA